MNCILGLDPGLAGTGWGIIGVSAGRVKHLAHGHINTSAGVPAGDRLSVIFDSVREIIGKYMPDIAGIEALYFARNRKSAIPVAQARGVLLLACSQANIKTFEYTPPEIKMALTGNGRADKIQVQELVRLVLGFKEKIEPDHAADALAVAVTAFHFNENRNLGPK